MQVAKWGNSLAVRLRAAVVKALRLKEGDDIEKVSPSAALVAAMQASPHREIEIEPGRGRMPVRDAGL